MKTCPRCKSTYTEYPALSRLDNKTDICSKCGTAEALYNFSFPGRQLPPINEKI